MGSMILLLVSDSDEDAVALQSAAEASCTVFVAANVNQAVQLLGQSPRLIVVSDRVEDAGMTCAGIRKAPGGATPPLVLLCDHDRSSLTAEADGVMTRPVDAAVLGAWLQAARRIRQLRLGQDVCGGIERKDCEQLLRTFARLSHAVNNPLQALFATVDMLMLNHGLSPEAASLASEAITHAGRVAKMVAEASSEAKQALQMAAPERPTQVT